MRLMRRVMALLTALMLLCPAAMAETTFLQHTADWTLEDVPLDILLTADVQAHNPYDETRLAMLQGVLAPLKLRLQTQGEDSAVTVMVGATEAVQLRQCGTSLQLSCLPGVVYSADEDPMSLLLGSETEEFSILGMRGEAETLLEDGLVLLKALMLELEDTADRRKVKTAIENMGTARSCTDFVVSKADAAKLPETLLRLCPEGWLREIISGLTFSGKQTLRVYRDADDEPLRVEYNGTCGPEGDLRTVKLVWRIRRDDKAHRDELSIKAPAKSGPDKNNLTFSRVMTKNKSGAMTLEGDFTYVVTSERKTTTWEGSFDLKNKAEKSADVITGNVTLGRKLPGESKTLKYAFKPDIRLAGDAENPEVTGTLEVRQLRGSGVLEQAVISITANRGEGIAWEEWSQLVDISAMDENALSQLQQHAASAIATAIVRPLIMLQGSDADWFFKDMPKESVDAVLDAANTSVTVE